MNPYLMRPPGFQPTFYMGKILKTGQYLIMSYRGLSIVIVDAHFFSLYRVTANGGVDASLIFFYDPMDNGLLPPGDGMFL